MKIIKTLLFTSSLALVLTSCGGGAEILSTPIENIDAIPLKEASLTEKEKQTWGHLDLVKDTIPGMSVDKAYAELLNGKSGKTVIVAVIDSGIDIEHEDLDDVIWTNSKEIPGNNKDDDNNGYVDDIHGWNFLGAAYDEQLELTRIVAAGDMSAPNYAEAKAELDKDLQRYSGLKTQYDKIYQQVVSADEALTAHFKKSDYTKEEVKAIKTEDETLMQAVETANFVFGNGMDSMASAKKQIGNGLEQIGDFVNYYYNVDHRGRKTNDNPDDLNDKPGYGDGNVSPVKKSESHGTHVAGIIAAERNNGKGVNGVANNVKIMSVRAVPNGDEYDKDIAMAIRYAVDNGAQIINASFGKYYSPHSDWVRDAIAYAGKNDVLFVNAAGNEGLDLDTKAVYPNDQVDNGPEVSDTFITVGALEPKYGSGMIAGFSNYGKINVDVFAPGAKVYSTTPENEYDTKGGTSMAAPAVAGIAALIRSYYPKLSASQVKQILMDSGLPVATKVVVGGDSNDVRPFGELTKSGKMANAYNALIMAQQLSK